MEQKTKRLNKKWSEEEIISIINYLAENPNIEQPTQKVYYNIFLRGSAINVGWESVKSKVRHLHKTFRRAEDYRTYVGVSICEEKLRKICPFYYKLKEIFSYGKYNEEMDILDSDETTEALDEYMNSSIILENSSQSNCSSFTNKPSGSAETINPNAVKENFELDVMKFENKFNPNKEQLEMMKEFRKEELVLKRKKIEIQERMMIFELEQNERMERTKVEMSERIAKLEMEKNERTARYELELKYRAAP